MRPLPLLAASAVLGLLLWPTLQPSFESLSLGILAVAGLSVLGGRREIREKLRPDNDRPASSSVFYASFLAFGLLLGMAFAAALPVPTAFLGDLQVRGRVATAAFGKEADITVGAWRPTGSEAWIPGDGRLRVRFPDGPPPPGRLVVVSGRAIPLDPTHLPGDADPIAAATRAGVAARLLAREALEVASPRPPPDVAGATHAGLLRAMLDGDQSGIPSEEKALLRATGTWHLVSISGLHIGLAAGLSVALARILTRPLALLWRRGGLRYLEVGVGIFAAAAYTDLAGWPLPAVRALWMGVLGLLAIAAGRRPSPWDLLSFAMLMTLRQEPGAIDNPSFLLSYGAMIGMLLVTARFTRWLPLDAPWVLRWPVTALGTSVGATLGTLPATALFFQDLPPLSPLANLWAVPLFGAIATPAVLASQLLPQPLGAAALWVADQACTLGFWGLSHLEGSLWHPAVGVLGAGALALVLLLRRDALVCGAGFLLVLGLAPTPRDFRVTFLAIGQGDAALVEWPDGRRWLVDGGPPGSDLLHALRRRGITTLDRVILSHPHPDHLGGLLDIAAGIQVRELRVGRLPEPGEDDFSALVGLVGRVVAAGGGAPVAMFPALANAGPWTWAWFLHPGPAFQGPKKSRLNDESLVLLLSYGRRKFLFAGDIEAAGEAALVAATSGMASGDIAAAGEVAGEAALLAATSGMAPGDTHPLATPLKVDVVKVAHHGSATSSTAAFVAATDPEVVVISCGFDNRYRHPRGEALRAWSGRRLWRTDQDGSVVVSTDGETLRETSEATPEAWRLRRREMVPAVAVAPAAVVGRR